MVEEFRYFMIGTQFNVLPCGLEHSEAGLAARIVMFNKKNSLWELLHGEKAFWGFDAAGETILT